MLSRVDKAHVHAEVYRSIGGEIDGLRQEIKRAERRRQQRRRRIQELLCLRWRRTQHLNPGTELHWFPWMVQRHWYYMSSHLIFRGVVRAGFGEKVYQYIEVQERTKGGRYGARMVMPVHWFCDPDLYEEMIAQGIDPTRYSLEPQAPPEEAKPNAN